MTNPNPVPVETEIHDLLAHLENLAQFEDFKQEPNGAVNAATYRRWAESIARLTAERDAAREKIAFMLQQWDDTRAFQSEYERDAAIAERDAAREEVEIANAECGAWASLVTAWLASDTDNVEQRARGMLDNRDLIGVTWLDEYVTRRERAEDAEAERDALLAKVSERALDDLADNIREAICNDGTYLGGYATIFRLLRDHFNAGRKE